MTTGDRALIVRALRAAAARIEAGGEPELYSVCPEEGLDYLHDPDALDPREYVDDEWHPDIEHLEWGVIVTVQAARIIELRCPGASGYDYWADYGLVDPLTHVDPDEEPCGDEECERCGGGVEVDTRVSDAG